MLICGRKFQHLMGDSGGRKRFFFEKKKQKTFALAGCGDSVAESCRSKVFFLLFFQKKQRLLTFPTNDQGFALLVVLWSVVFLAFLMTQILATSRTAVSLAGNLRAAAQAHAADDGAISEAIFRALAPGALHWAADGKPHELVVGDVGVTVTLRNLGGMVNPNIASQALLAGLLRAVGEPGGAAAEIAQNITDWRSPPASLQAGAALLQTYREAGLAYGPPATQFSDLDQLTDVLGVTPDLLARLMPHVSLFQASDPDPVLADPVVRAAIVDAGDTAPAGTGDEGPPSIIVLACASGPAMLCRHAVVSLPGMNAQTPFQVEQLGDGR
jgi:general secretion pathway protein K